MKLIYIKNFVCECGCEEYSAINFNPIICVCDKCGKVISSKDHEIRVEEIEEE
jgi:hypothetical protein